MSYTKMDAPPSTLLSRNEIPIIDLENKGLAPTTSKEWLEKIAKQLDKALRNNCGVVFFINHGIAEKKLQDVNKAFAKFFALPENVKSPYLLGSPDYLDGYIPAGSENLSGDTQQEVRECYNITTLSEPLPTKEVPDIKELVGEVVDDFLSLCRFLMRVIAVMLEVDPEVFLDYHKGMFDGTKTNLTTLRPLFYPALGDKPIHNKIRCGEHTDWGTLTLLAQDSEGGLEIFNGKEWHRVGYLAGALLLNLGDTFEMWTSSKYKAIQHRVVIPSDAVSRAKCRHCLAFFVHPDNDTTTDPVFLANCRNGNQMKTSNQHAVTAYEHAMKKRGDSYMKIDNASLIK